LFEKSFCNKKSCKKQSFQKTQHSTRIARKWCREVAFFLGAWCFLSSVFFEHGFSTKTFLDENATLILRTRLFHENFS